MLRTLFTLGSPDTYSACMLHYVRYLFHRACGLYEQYKNFVY